MTGRRYNALAWFLQSAYALGSMVATVHEAVAHHVCGAIGWSIHALVGSGWLTLYVLNRHAQVVAILPDDKSEKSKT